MALMAVMIKWRDGAEKIPLKELEQTNPLGESLVYQDKRPSKCATPSCKIQTFSNFSCKLILNWRRKRGRSGVVVAALCIVPTIPANPAAAWTRLVPILNPASVSAVANAASVLRRCRYASLAGACIWGWRWD